MLLPEHVQLRRKSEKILEMENSLYVNINAVIADRGSWDLRLVIVVV